jgi:hypothetical protein
MGGKIEDVGEIMKAKIIGQAYALRRKLKWVLAK